MKENDLNNYRGGVGKTIIKCTLMFHLLSHIVSHLIKPHNYKALDKLINKCCAQVKEPESQALLIRKSLRNGGLGVRAESKKKGK